MAQSHTPPPGAAPQSLSPDQMQQMQQTMTGKTQSGGAAGSQTSSTAQPPKPPREMGSLTDEAQRAVQDVSQGILHLPLELLHGVMQMLGLQREPKTPEEQQRLQQFHQNMQRLNAEQMQAFQVRMQQEQQRKEMMRQEEEMRAAQRQQAESQGMSVPGGKVSGQGALDAMNQQRKGMGGASG